MLDEDHGGPDEGEVPAAPVHWSPAHAGSLPGGDACRGDHHPAGGPPPVAWSLPKPNQPVDLSGLTRLPTPDALTASATPPAAPIPLPRCRLWQPWTWKRHRRSPRAAPCGSPAWPCLNGQPQGLCGRRGGSGVAFSLGTWAVRPRIYWRMGCRWLPLTCQGGNWSCAGASPRRW